MDDRRPRPGLKYLPEIVAWIGRRKPAFFLDFDGTLAPVAPHPDLAELPAGTRRTLGALARDHVVCLVSGRALADLRNKIGLTDVYYAADHGYRILGPTGANIELEVRPDDASELEAAAFELERRLHRIEGVVVETKDVSLSVHYRLVAESERPLVEQVVAEVAEDSPGLRLTSGKLVHDLMPALPWDKGRATLWLLKRLRLGRMDACPVCLGDDLSDEDMFSAAGDWGVTVAVGDPESGTRAAYVLRDCYETAAFLEAFVSPSG